MTHWLKCEGSNCACNTAPVNTTALLKRQVLRWAMNLAVPVEHYHNDYTSRFLILTIVQGCSEEVRAASLLPQRTSHALGSATITSHSQIGSSYPVGQGVSKSCHQIPPRNPFSVQAYNWRSHSHLYTRPMTVTVAKTAFS